MKFSNASLLFPCCSFRSSFFRTAIFPDLNNKSCMKTYLHESFFFPARLWLQRNIDIGIPDYDGLTSLHRPKARGYTEIVEALLTLPDIQKPELTTSCQKKSNSTTCCCATFTPHGLGVQICSWHPASWDALFRRFKSFVCDFKKGPSPTNQTVRYSELRILKRQTTFRVGSSRSF